MHPSKSFGLGATLKYRLRGLVLAVDSYFFGQTAQILLPNGKTIHMRFCFRDAPSFQGVINEEIGGYWEEHQPAPGEVHLDVGAQIGSYTLLATSAGARVIAFEPDPNNRRFLRRNLKLNHLGCTLVEKGTWNEQAHLPWRTNTASSSIAGVGSVPSSLPSIDQIAVDRIDNLLKTFKLSRVDVIKMDIEGAEIEALEGAEETIKRFRPTLLVEAYHVRDGRPTTDRVLALLNRFGVDPSCIKVTPKGLVVAKNY